MKENRMHIHKADVEPLEGDVVENGPVTQIDGRVKRVLPYMSNDDAFYLTYDDVSATSMSCHPFGQSLGGQLQTGARLSTSRCRPRA
jgi:hypothetical protein